MLSSFTFLGAFTVGVVACAAFIGVVAYGLYREADKYGMV
jgi:hypothetical protein